MTLLYGQHIKSIQEHQGMCKHECHLCDAGQNAACSEQMQCLTKVAAYLALAVNGHICDA